MAQVINDPFRNAGDIGEALGGSVSTGLRHLINTKLENKQRQPIVNSLVQMGIDPHAADYISRQPSAIQQKLLQDYSGAGQQQFGMQQQPQGFQMQGQQPQQQMQEQYQPEQYPQHGGGQFQQGQAQAQTSPFGGKKREEFAQKQKLAEQKAINARYAPYIKESNKGLENADAMIEQLEAFLRLDATGKVASGLKSAIVPERFMNAETQEAIKASNTMAGLLSQQSGVQTGFKIKYAETQKPNINMNPVARRHVAENLLKEARAVKLKGEIRNQLIEQNDYEIPRGLDVMVDKKYKEYQKNPASLLSDIQDAQENQQQAQSQEQNQQGEQQPQYNTEEESPLGSVVRRGLSAPARAAEAIAGFPGDLASLGLGAANWATSGATPTYEDVQKKLPVSLPTSQQLQEATGRATKGYTNPQGKAEETIDNVVGIVAGLWGPSFLKPKLINGLAKILSPKGVKVAATTLMPFSGTTWQKALKIGAAGEAGSLGAEALGAGPAGQGAAKFAFMTMAGLHGTKGKLKEAQKSAYAARDAVVEGPLSKKNTMPINSTIKKVKDFIAKTERGAHTDKDIILDVAKQVESGLEKSKGLAADVGLQERAGVADVLTQKKHINQRYGLATRQYVSGDKYLPESARGELGELGRILEEPLEAYGKKVPEFGMNHAYGNDIQKGLAYEKNAEEFFQGSSMFSTNIGSYVTKVLLKMAGNVGAKKFMEAVHLIKDSPVAMQYYKEAMIAAAQGATTAATKAAVKLDREIQRIEKKNQ